MGGAPPLSAERICNRRTDILNGYDLMLERLYTFASEQLAVACDLVLQYAQPTKPVTAPPAASMPAPLTSKERWARATSTIAAAVSGFERVEQMQSAATYQLDAADYSLQHLIKGLAAVMPTLAVPADGSELRAILAEAAEQEHEIAVETKVLAA